MAVLSQSEPPSAGAFGYGDTIEALLQFHSAKGSPFMINQFPFFAYQSDPRPNTLAFCLFQPNAGRDDSATDIKYMNMFDAQVSDREGKLLAEHMAKLGQPNEEVSGDEDSEEEDADGMGEIDIENSRTRITDGNLVV